MRAAGLWLLLLVAVAAGARAQTAAAEDQPGAPPEAAPAEPAPGDAAPPAKQPLDLERLLKPRGLAAAPSGQSFGGRDREAWQNEFRKARAEVGDLERRVGLTQDKLRDAAAGDWNYSPSGGEATDPEVLKLRAQLKRDRQSLETSRQRLRDLDVEASLAGVPEDWRE